MASFKGWAETPGTQRYALINTQPSYQRLEWDSANWTGGAQGVGRLVGTNMSVSGFLLQSIQNRQPNPRQITEAEVRNLSKDRALAVYELEFFIPMEAARIPSQEVANLYLDYASSRGKSAAGKAMRVALGKLGAEPAAKGWDKLADAAAAQDQQKLYNALRSEIRAYYASHPRASAYLARLDKYHPEGAIVTTDTPKKILSRALWATIGLGLILGMYKILK